MLRAFVMVAVGLTLLFGGLIWELSRVVDAFVDQLMGERVTLAQTTATHLEQLLTHDLTEAKQALAPRLLDNTVSDDADLTTALTSVTRNTLLPVSPFVLDADGALLAPAGMTMPPGVRQNALASLHKGKPIAVYSRIARDAGELSLLTAVGKAKEPRGYVGVLLLGRNIHLADVLGRVATGGSGLVELIGPDGELLASSNGHHYRNMSGHEDIFADAIRARRSVRARCHRCHEKGAEILSRSVDVLAFAPLPTLPFGIAVRQAESDALAPAFAMRRELLGLAVLLAVALCAGVIFYTRRLVGPVMKLSHAVAALDENGFGPLPELGGDEVGQLARAMAGWRQRLQGSLQTIIEQERQLLRHQQRRELLRRVLSAQEDERCRIARELHDTVSQDVAALRLRVERLAAANSPPAPAQLEQVEVQLRDILETVRRLTLDLRPLILEQMGFLPALRWHLERLQKERGIRTALLTEGEELPVPSLVAQTLFRIFQECLTNVESHAHAEHLMVSVTITQTSVDMTLEDDGVGFAPEKMPPPGEAGLPRGLGLLGMEERAQLLGGELNIDSSEGEGTVINVRVPLPTSTAKTALVREESA